MKQIKKVMALVLALAMVMGTMSLTAFAADPDGKITVDNAINGEEYDLYKVFDLTYGGNGESGATGTTDTGATPGTYTPVSYTYTADGNSDQFLAALQGATTLFKITADPATAGRYNVVRKDGATDANIIKFVQDNISKLPASKKIGGTKTASGNKVEWTGLAYGYYYVSSTAGSFVTIDSTIKEVTVKEKNTVPTGDKSQSATSDGTYADTTLHLNYGDTVYYQYVITNGKGSDNEIKFTDTMTAGLDLNQDAITVVDKDGTALPTTAYSLTKSAHGFVLTLTAAYVKTMGASDTVTVKYSATINKDAKVDDPDDNSNTGKLEYSNQTSEETIYVATYDFQLFKTDGSAFLDGAGFKLYDAATEGNQIKVAKDSTGYYVDANGTEEIMVNSANGVNVRGLAPGKYYLEETTTPEGYNQLSERKEVEVKKDATGAVQVTVVNQKGTELPSTGGIGTTIFYILGAGLVIGAVVMLVARKKAEKKAE